MLFLELFIIAVQDLSQSLITIVPQSLNASKLKRAEITKTENTKFDKPLKRFLPHLS